jgi:hypothetical protein
MYFCLKIKAKKLFCIVFFLGTLFEKRVPKPSQKLLKSQIAMQFGGIYLSPSHIVSHGVGICQGGRPSINRKNIDKLLLIWYNKCNINHFL